MSRLLLRLRLLLLSSTFRLANFLSSQRHACSCKGALIKVRDVSWNRCLREELLQLNIFLCLHSFNILLPELLLMFCLHSFNTLLVLHTCHVPLLPKLLLLLKLVLSMLGN